MSEVFAVSPGGSSRPPRNTSASSTPNGQADRGVSSGMVSTVRPLATSATMLDTR